VTRETLDSEGQESAAGSDPRAAQTQKHRAPDLRMQRAVDAKINDPTLPLYDALGLIYRRLCLLEGGMIRRSRGRRD